MSRGGERAPVVAELLCADPAPLDLDFPAGAGQVMGCVDRPADPGAVAGDDGAPAVPVPALAAVWCRSVGATWTVELHELDRGAALGPIVDWISSGVPISEPEPTAALARELLTERGFQLFPDSSAGPRCPHRHGIGYACRNADLTEAGTRGARPGRGPVATPPGASRIRAALPRAGEYPGTGVSRPLRPAQPAHRSRRSGQAPRLATQDTAAGHDR